MSELRQAVALLTSGYWRKGYNTGKVMMGGERDSDSPTDAELAILEENVMALPRTDYRALAQELAILVAEFQATLNEASYDLISEFGYSWHEDRLFMVDAALAHAKAAGLEVTP